MQYQFSQTGSITYENGLTTNGRLLLPNVEPCGLDFAPCFPFPLHGFVCEVYSPLAQLSPMRARRDSPYQHKDAEAYPKWVPVVLQQWTAKPASVEKHHAFGRLLSQVILERLFRQRGRDACSHFFPRSVGLGPTDSFASGALVMQPSILSQLQSMPFSSS